MHTRIAVALSVVILLGGCATQETPTISGPIDENEQISKTEETSKKITSFSKLWPRSFSKSELVEVALNNAYSAFEVGQRRASDQRLTFLVEPGIVEALATCSRIAANRMLIGLEAFLHPQYRERELFFVLGKSSEWMVETVVNTGADLPSQEYAQGTATISFPDWMRSIIQPGIKWGTAEDSVAFFVFDSNLTCNDLGSASAHEVFHLIHMSLDNRSLMDVKPGLDPKMAAWFYEGSAEFFSRSIQSFHGEAKYVSPKLNREPGGLKAHAPLDAPQMLYTYGHAAVEYIVANVGVNAVMKVYEGVGAGQNFSKAFEEGIGLSLEDFYALFDSLVIYE